MKVATVSYEDQLDLVLSAPLVSVVCWQKQEQIVVRRGGAGCRPRPYQSHVYDNCDECEELLCFSQQLSWQKIFHYKLITTILSVLSVLCPARVDALLHPARHFTLCLGPAFIFSFPILICEGIWSNKQQTASKSPNARRKIWSKIEAEVDE